MAERALMFTPQGQTQLDAVLSVAGTCTLIPVIHPGACFCMREMVGLCGRVLLPSMHGIHPLKSAVENRLLRPLICR